MVPVKRCRTTVLLSPPRMELAKTQVSPTKRSTATARSGPVTRENIQISYQYRTNLLSSAHAHNLTHTRAFMYLVCKPTCQSHFKRLWRTERSNKKNPERIETNTMVKCIELKSQDIGACKMALHVFVMAKKWKSETPNDHRLTGTEYNAYASI